MMDCTDVKNFKPGGVYLQADSGTTELSAEAERCTYCGRRGKIVARTHCVTGNTALH